VLAAEFKQVTGKEPNGLVRTLRLRRTMAGVLAKAWTRWKVIAGIIGNFQARLLLLIFYFTIVPPFALIVKLLKDPLMLRPPSGKSLWVEGPSADSSLPAARRQS
jgi:hypothetical protein